MRFFAALTPAARRFEQFLVRYPFARPAGEAGATEVVGAPFARTIA